MRLQVHGGGSLILTLQLPGGIVLKIVLIIRMKSQVRGREYATQDFSHLI